jgi:hypothetical protein
MIKDRGIGRGRAPNTLACLFDTSFVCLQTWCVKAGLYRQQNDNLVTSSIERIVARLKREKEEKEGIKNCRNKFVLLNKTEKLNTPWELAAKTRSTNNDVGN